MTPPGRRAREKMIFEIIQKRPIRTQSELVNALDPMGFSVTQATVSRDIQRLGIVKRTTGDGKIRYVRSGFSTPPPITKRALKTALSEFATHIDTGDVLLSIRTQSGCANVVAEAIDVASLEGVVGTIAGDNTIFVLVHNTSYRTAVMQELKSLAGTR